MKHFRNCLFYNETTSPTKIEQQINNYIFIFKNTSRITIQLKESEYRIYYISCNAIHQNVTVILITVIE